MYKKLSGITGTEQTESQELSSGVSPTNVPVARQGLDDEIYRSARKKYVLLKEKVHLFLEYLIVLYIDLHAFLCLYLFV